MLQIIEYILIFSIIHLTNTISIYPVYNREVNTQWEDDLWQNCETKSKILPVKCSEDENDWQECYEVPKDGLCLIQDFSTSSQGKLMFNITFASAIGKSIEIEINKNSVKQTLTTNSFWLEQDIDSKIISIKILASGVLLSDLQISSDCSLNCKECDTDNTCKSCQDNYFLFYYKCIPQTCGDQISQLSSGSHISSTSEIELNTTNLLITSTFNIALNECLSPKIYLTKSIEDNTITAILEEQQVKLNDGDNKVLQYYLTPEQFQTCQNIVTLESIVYQCIIGIAITMNKQTQYLLMIISQIEIEKQTQSYSNSIQIFELPTSNTESSVVGPIIIISDASNSIIDTQNQLIQTTQNVRDSNYQIYSINFLNGSITQNSTSIPLTLEDQQNNGSATELILSYDNSQFNQSQDYNITISSLLTQNSNRRVLGERNIIPQLEIYNNLASSKVQYSTVVLNKNNPQNSPINGGYLALIFISAIILSFIFIIATIVIIKKVENKYFIKQNDDRRIPTDQQQI